MLTIHLLNGEPFLNGGTENADHPTGVTRPGSDLDT